MKTPSLVLLALAALAPALNAAENPAAKPAPQPRARLDPVSRTSAVVAPASPGNAAAQPMATTSSSSASAVTMEKYVVKETGPLPSPGPSHPAEQKGKFSLTDGGYLAQGEAGKAQWEIGAWPWLPWTDVMAEDAVKFPKPRTRVEVDVVRVHW